MTTREVIGAAGKSGRYAHRGSMDLQAGLRHSSRLKNGLVSRYPFRGVELRVPRVFREAPLADGTAHAVLS